jgi:hypothetical protein
MCMVSHTQVVLQVGSTVFVHAGVLPEHARYGLERMNTCAPCCSHAVAMCRCCIVPLPPSQLATLLVCETHWVC